MSEIVKKVKVEDIFEKTERLSPVKRVFDRIWVTFMIVINSMYGLIVSTFACYAIINESYNVERYVTGFIMGTVAIIVANGINWITRKYLRNY